MPLVNRLPARIVKPWAQAFCLASCLAGFALAVDDYDPLQLPEDHDVGQVDLEVSDVARNRTIPLRVYLPAGTLAAPCVLFSHGLGGTRESCAYLAQHWSARGYLTVSLQHPGSDDSVWKKVPPAQRLAAMHRAASISNFILRVQDVAAALDRLESWNGQPDHPLHGRVDLSRLGMSGHSFGAQTTQAVSGMSLPILGERHTDARIKAAVIFSPGLPRGREPDQAFRQVTIPWLLMTGTKDTSPIGGQTVDSRLAVFTALPPGRKYQAVLDSAEHSAFTDRAIPGDREPRNPNHHRVILAVSTAFWDAYLADRSAARAWLDGSGPQGVMQDKDRWQTK